MRFLATLVPALVVMPAQAETAVERQVEITARTAPHVRLAPASKPVVVHYVHRKDDFQSSPVIQAGLQQIKQAVALCVEGNRRLGKPANPPTIFPDQVLRSHEFEYAAPNRSIIYNLNYHASMADDCSLIETASLTAKLRSSKGSCLIDLDRKTAKGACDANGHANAPARPRPDAAGQQAAMAADPRMAKLMAMLRQSPGASAGAGAAANAQRRTIAGFECKMVDALPGARGCISQAGSFVPISSAGMGMALYREFAKYTSIAVEARFDLPLASAIFTPYLGGGYTITSKEEQ